MPGCNDDKRTGDVIHFFLPESFNCPPGEQILMVHSGVTNVGLIVHALLE